MSRKSATKQNDSSAKLGFEAQLWAAADKLRGNMEPSDYKHVALGLIFLKYISDAFEAKRAALLTDALADPEDPEEYLAENVFWVPKKPAGRICKPEPSRRRSARTSTTPCWRLRPETPHSRAFCPRTTPARRSTR